MNSPLQENEARWRELFDILEQPAERLAAIVQQSSQIVPLPEEKRVPENLVPGCVSRVWLTGKMAEGQCFFEADGDSSIMRAFAVMACDLRNGCEPEIILKHDLSIWRDYRLIQGLSPTRQNGLMQIERRMRELAVLWINEEGNNDA